MRLRLLLFLVLFCTCELTSFAQEAVSKIDKALNFPEKFVNKLQKKSAHLERQVLRKTEKYLKRLAEKERKIYGKLLKIDSAKASALIAESKAKYDAVLNSLKKSPEVSVKSSGEYLPYIDSLNGILTFVGAQPGVLGSSESIQKSIGASLQQFKSLQSRLTQSDGIKQFIQERRDYLKSTLGTYTNLPKVITSELDKFNVQYSYYSLQIREYRQLLNDPDKLTIRTLALLNKVPAFTAFLQKNSQLAGLFSIPTSYNTTQGINGLQTIDQVRLLVINQVGSGANAMAAVQQNMQVAQTKLGQLKDKINQLGGGSGDIEIPQKKVNHEKVKTFWKRLEYGSNLQSSRSNYYFPISTDIGLSVGYKFSAKTILGVGMSYRVGWGKDIRHIEITHEGVGFRSFFDTKVKGSFFASAGFEYNYQQPIKLLTQLQNLNNWQQSGLAGVTKIVSIKSKVFKKTKLQLLWDFLSYSQRPVAQPFKFRVGYTF